MFEFWNRNLVSNNTWCACAWSHGGQHVTCHVEAEHEGQREQLRREALVARHALGLRGVHWAGANRVEQARVGGTCERASERVSLVPGGSCRLRSRTNKREESQTSSATCRPSDSAVEALEASTRALARAWPNNTWSKLAFAEVGLVDARKPNSETMSGRPVSEWICSSSAVGASAA